MSEIFNKNLRLISKFEFTPKGWREISVRDVCDLGRGRVISHEEIKSNPGPYPVYSSQTSSDGLMGSLDSYVFNSELITWTTDGANAGTVFFRQGKFNCTNVCGTLAAKSADDIDLRFLTYQIGRIAKQYVSYHGNPKLMNDVMGRVALVIPSQKAEQQRIAEILSTIDQAIEKTEALIHKYQQIKAGLMHDLFTRGLTAVGKLRPPREQAPELYQETPIGWIPKEWAFELLDQLTDRGSGHTPNRNIPDYWNGGIKWISLSDSRRLDKLYISDTDFEISQLGIQNSSAVLQPSGVVVMSRDAGVGKSAITTEPMAVSQHFMCWKCGSKMDNHFLYYWLQFKKRMFENIAMGSTIVTIGLPYFKRLSAYP